MSRTASSKGPGIGSSPTAASHRRGFGMRLSLAAIRTARMSRRKNRLTVVTVGSVSLSGPGSSTTPKGVRSQSALRQGGIIDEEAAGQVPDLHHRDRKK